jgi:hypothetical protein
MAADTKLEALRSLLAKHQLCADDQRSGHHYTFEEPAETLRLKPRRERAKRNARGVLTMVGRTA